jgi:hypothetical protein
VGGTCVLGTGDPRRMVVAASIVHVECFEQCFTLSKRYPFVTIYISMNQSSIDAALA